MMFKQAESFVFSTGSSGYIFIGSGLLSVHGSGDCPLPMTLRIRSFTAPYRPKYGIMHFGQELQKLSRLRIQAMAVEATVEAITWSQVTGESLEVGAEVGVLGSNCQPAERYSA